MSMHFAPQWNKPIKPTGTTSTISNDTPPTPSTTKPRPAAVNTTPDPSVPFPALSPVVQSSGHGANGSVQPSSTSLLSYSRVTHTPLSPSFPEDGYFPSSGLNGSDPNPHPFRYSKEQMLALWDEEKVRDPPIELSDLLESGGVLVSQEVVKPVGLRDLTELEKKLLSTTVHPPAPTRRTVGNGPAAPEPPSSQLQSQPRRPAPPSSVKDPSSTSTSRLGGMGAFGRVEGGGFGGASKLGATPGSLQRVEAEGRQPGALGGGFAGIGKRPGRRTESSDGAPAAPWRATRTISGNFEGVLGFASSSTPAQPPPPDPPAPTTPTNSSSAFDPMAHPQAPSTANWRDKDKDLPKEKEPEATFGSGGGPGWGMGPKKWRIAAGLPAPEVGKPPPQTLDIPMTDERRSASVAAVPPETPVGERDAMISEAVTPVVLDELDAPHTPSQPLRETASLSPELGDVQWYYRDPGGQEQGPFSATNMQLWYSEAYFQDDLPLRRAHESTFHTVAQLKVDTGNPVQPFLSPVRPRNAPPNLPVPLSALRAAQSPQGAAPAINGVADMLRNFGLNDQHGAPGPLGYPTPNHFDSQYPQRSARPPEPYEQLVSPPSAPYQPQMPPTRGWGSPEAPNRAASGFGSISLQSPVGPASMPYPPQDFHFPQPTPQHVQSPYSPFSPSQEPARPDPFSPVNGVGAIPPSPWGVPPPQDARSPYAPPQQPPMHQQPWQQPIEPQPQQGHSSYGPATQRYQPQEQPWDLPGSQPTSIPDFPEHQGETHYPEEAEAQPQEEEHEEPEDFDEERPETPAAESFATQSPVSVAPVTSAWGQIPSPAIKSSITSDSLKSSLVLPATPASPVAPAANTSRLPPAPASLPPKPVTTTNVETSSPIQTTPDKANLPSRPAPWANREETRKSSGGFSLREIQDAEAKEAEARRAARPSTGTPTPLSAVDDTPPQILTWGLPSSQQKGNATPTSAPAQPAASPWGGGDAAPKKTLKQIQEEEEKRKARLAQATEALKPVSVANGVQSVKRGYADLAAVSQTPQTAAAGWTTVGHGGKSGATKSSITSAPRPASIPAKPVASIPAKPVVSAPPVKAKANGAVTGDESNGPSLDFLRWCKQALTGLNVNVDEFIQMLLTFPIDPPASSRPEVLEIISDSVYANSSTLDGRRFAQEFFTRRKADAAKPKGVNGSATNGMPKATSGTGSLADVVKSLPKKSEDAGFRVVKAKGKKKN